MYTVIDLGPGVNPSDIDEHGNVLAQVGFPQRPWLFPTSGPAIDISAKVGVPIFRALGMNDNGQIAAEGNGGFVCHVASGEAQPVALESPFAINNAGLMVGRGDIGPAYAHLSASDDVRVFADDSGGSALDLNEAGTMVGVGFAGSLANRLAFSFREGAGLEVESIGVATGINEAGTIVGVGGGAGFVIDAAGTKTTVMAAGARFTSVLAVDDTGRHVGLMVSTTELRRGFVGKGAAITDLTSLLLGAPSVVVEMGVAINNAGWIAATGWVDGEPHGLLLKPIEPPSRYPTLASLVHILVGARLGEGGIGIGPHGPEPIPPGPLRDGLVGMALTELAELLDDRGTRAAVRALGLERLEVALEHALGEPHTSAVRHAGACELGHGFPTLSELQARR